MSTPPRTIVVDTSVLIDFIKVGRLDLLATLPNTRAIITNHVDDEILPGYPKQRAILKNAIIAGHISRIEVNSPEEMSMFADLESSGLGAGERSAFAVAFYCGFSVVIDDVRACDFAKDKLREVRLLSFLVIMRKLIRSRKLTVFEADELLREWKTDPKFRHQKLNSFKEIL